MLNTYLESKTSKIDYKTLNVFKNVLENSSNNIKSSSDISGINKILDEIIIVLIKLKKLESNPDKNLKKSLNKEENVSKQKELILNY